MVGSGKRKIEVKLIENKASKQVCFSKRHKGLMNKARELSVLSGAQVAVLTFTPAGKPVVSDASTLKTLIDMAALKDSASKETSPVVPADGNWESENATTSSKWFQRVDAQSMQREELLLFERALLEYREAMLLARSQVLNADLDAGRMVPVDEHECDEAIDALLQDAHPPTLNDLLEQQQEDESYFDPILSFREEEFSFLDFF